MSILGALDTPSAASMRKPGDTPATPLNTSPESIQAIRDALSPDIERSKELYHQKGKEEAAAKFPKLHAAHMDLQQRFDLEHTRMSSHVHRW